MNVATYVKLASMRAVILTASLAVGQQSSKPAADPCKTVTPPAVVQKESQKAGGKLGKWLDKKIRTASGGMIDGGDVGSLAESVKPQPKPCVPKQPAPVPIKEVCPVGMQLGTDENGKHLCSDVAHTSEPAKFTPLGPSAPAPVNSSQAPVAR